MPKVERHPEPEDIPRPVPEADIAKIIGNSAPHLGSFLVLTRLFGLRRMEAEDLTMDHIDWEKKAVYLEGADTKGFRGEVLPANELAMHQPMSLPCRCSKIWQTGPRPRDRRAGLGDRYKAHAVRASYITALAHVAAGGVVMQLARHKAWATTQKYLKVADKAKRAAVEQMGASSVAGYLASANAPSYTQNLHTKPKQEKQKKTKAA
jgi:integrase